MQETYTSVNLFPIHVPALYATIDTIDTYAYPKMWKFNKDCNGGMIPVKFRIQDVSKQGQMIKMRF
jgi:hypothetical protein